MTKKIQNGQKNLIDVNLLKTISCIINTTNSSSKEGIGNIVLYCCNFYEGYCITSFEMF